MLVASRLGRVWGNEYFQTVVTVVVIVGLVFGFWYGVRLALNTQYPMLAVASGSMHLPQNTECDGWSHPFAHTLHTGDLIVVEGVNPEDIYAAPLNESGRSGDIIVFRAIGSDDLIVHRAVGKVVQSGRIFFITQGDHNTVPGPSSPTPAENVIGRVVMRVPWFGHLALQLHNSTGWLVIVALIVLLVVVEFVLPEVWGKKPEAEPDEHLERVPESEGPI